MKTSLKKPAVVEADPAGFAPDSETAAALKGSELGGGVALAVPVAESKSLVTAEDRGLSFSNEGLDGEFTRDDIQIPGLNLVQSVGPLSEHFTPGQMVYNKEEVIGDKDNPVQITLLRMSKFYVEKLPYGSEVMPRKFKTEAEARAAGLVPLWEKQEGCGNFEPVLSCQVLIKGDPAKNTTWPIEFQGVPYAMARFTLRSVAYSATGKTLISASQFALREGLHTGYWNITPKREKVGANMVWIPRVRMAGKHTPEFIAFAKSCL